MAPLAVKELGTPRKGGNGGRDLKKGQPLLDEGTSDKKAREIFGCTDKDIAFRKLPAETGKVIKPDPKDIEALKGRVAVGIAAGKRDGTEHRILGEFYCGMVSPETHAAKSKAALKNAGIMPKE